MAAARLHRYTAPSDTSPDEQRALVDRYLAAYNALDVDGTVALLHPEVEFRNVSGGEVHAAASGVAAFRALAEQSRALFASRRQTVTAFASDGDAATAVIAYEGVLAADLPNGARAGETVRPAGPARRALRVRVPRRAAVPDHGS